MERRPLFVQIFRCQTNTEYRTMNTNIVTQRLAMADAPPHVSARIMTVLMAATLAGGLLATDAQARGGGGHGGGGGHVGGFGGWLPALAVAVSVGSIWVAASAVPA
jgi:hypothetical protein